jgi:hypothetical protein
VVPKVGGSSPLGHPTPEQRFRPSLLPSDRAPDGALSTLCQRAASPGGSLSRISRATTLAARSPMPGRTWLWWTRDGGQVEANGEMERVRRYSSRDAAGLQALITDPRWSNEGLFALLEGLRRLATLGSVSRLALPMIETRRDGG